MMKTFCAPVILFVYNRPDHVKKTISALQKNDLTDQSVLFIYSDGPRSEEDSSLIREVRNYVSSIEGFREIYVIEREKNWALEGTSLTV